MFYKHSSKNWLIISNLNIFYSITTCNEIRGGKIPDPVLILYSIQSAILIKSSRLQRYNAEKETNLGHKISTKNHNYWRWWNRKYNTHWTEAWNRGSGPHQNVMEREHCRKWKNMFYKHSSKNWLIISNLNVFYSITTCYEIRGGKIPDPVLILFHSISNTHKKQSLAMIQCWKRNELRT